jgi:uncharacterized protein DUF6361
VTSLVAWLDASAEEQRRVREIVQLFSQRETQDELGGRRIVVTLSDALFPGTSVLHSRARYLLFIPWFAKLSAAKRDAVGSFEWLERRMIKSFLEASSPSPRDRLVGLIGRDAGPKVRQLPSSAYWTALDAWGVLLRPGTIPDTLSRTSDSVRQMPADDADELADRRLGVWHPGVGEPSRGFPEQNIDGGFQLKEHEARWLRERWIATSDGSLLAHLARTTGGLTGEWAPWLEPNCMTAPPDIVRVLDEAERFSLALAGARLLYYLMIGERYEEQGFDRVDVGLSGLRDGLDDWAAEVDDRQALFDRWDPREFWSFVRTRNARVDELTRRFFSVWFDRVRQGDVDGIGDDDRLRDAVEGRERFVKRCQARLTNSKLLAGWQGGFPSRVTFRWTQVSRLVTDLREGLRGSART